ncbi:MAG: thioredoxin family protein [Syntrophales bacterium]|nr:thioredoxin family protein [Syntrophales bacterium]MDY0043576.1 thioredoxin family protein [Syntrophales bacterium]
MKIDEATIESIKNIFEKQLVNPIECLLFTSDMLTGSCDNRSYNEFAKELLETFSELNHKISITHLDLADTEGQKRGLVISPTILLGAGGHCRIQYWGAPTGHQSGPFIEAMLTASKTHTPLSDRSKKSLRRLDHEILIECFVSPDCPYCPGAVRLTNHAALECRYITSRIIDITQSMNVALLYQVSSTPHLVINEDPEISISGAPDEEMLLEKILFEKDPSPS